MDEVAPVETRSDGRGESRAGPRIAHFTDIHVTGDASRIPWVDLLSKRLLGWINLRLLGRSALFADAEDVMRAFLEDLAAVAPDHIVCTGDLTALSLPGEFEKARRMLSPLLEDPRVIGIPGNHDVYVRSAEREKLYERAFGCWTRTDLSPGDFPEDLRHLHPYPLVRFLDPGAVLIALKDVHPNPLHDSSGRVGAEQLDLLGYLLVAPRIASRTKIIALHCGTLRAGGPRGRVPDRVLHRLKDGKKLLRICEEAGVALIIHGHTHRRFVERAGPLTPVFMANPGSLTSSQHDRTYHVYAVCGGTLEIEVRRYDEARGAFAPWPDAPGAGPMRR